jgi:hypothetical protein
MILVRMLKCVICKQRNQTLRQRVLYTSLRKSGVCGIARVLVPDRLGWLEDGLLAGEHQVLQKPYNYVTVHGARTVLLLHVCLPVDQLLRRMRSSSYLACSILP